LVSYLRASCVLVFFSWFYLRFAIFAIVFLASAHYNLRRSIRNIAIVMDKYQGLCAFFCFLKVLLHGMCVCIFINNSPARSLLPLCCHAPDSLYYSAYEKNPIMQDSV
jgi:hypothetical protein